MEKIVLIPAYKPKIKLIEFTDQLIKQGFRVIVIDDGSTEKYDGIFNSLNKRIMLVRYPVNQGKGSAIKTGLRYLKENIKNDFLIITADADGQHSISDIKMLGERYETCSHCLMLGVRDFNKENVPLRSRLGNVITRNIFTAVTKQSLSDTQTGLRCFDDTLIDFMLSICGNRFEYETNVLLESTRKGVSIIEEPISTIYENNNEESNFNTITDYWAIYKKIIKFASSSLIAFLIDYSLYIFLLFLTKSWAVAASVTFANVTARLISGSINFTVNRKLIFASQENLVKSAISYFMLACAILLCNTILLNILIEKLFIGLYISKLLTELTFFAISYLVQKNIIFKKNKITA